MDKPPACALEQRALERKGPPMLLSSKELWNEFLLAENPFIAVTTIFSTLRLRFTASNQYHTNHTAPKKALDEDLKP